MTVTRAMAIMGIEARGSTWLLVLAVFACAADRFNYTLLISLWKGRPRSRAKDQIMRDAVARNPMTAHQASATTMEAITVAPAFDLTPL